MTDLAPIDHREIKAITFDYFGTLVNVDHGAAGGMARVLRAIGRTDLDPLETYLRWDVENVRLYRGSAYRRYREVAAEAMGKLLADLTPGATPGDASRLSEMLLLGLVEGSAPHPEVPAVLDALARSYRLMPVTNMDSDLFARSALAARFPDVTTAEMARAYKPSERIFRLALDRLGLTQDAVLHVAISPWADIEGAKPLGMKVVWVNRGDDVLGKWTPRPDREIASLDGLRDILHL
jgi:2-haloacid dehalogenase